MKRGRLAVHTISPAPKARMNQRALLSGTLRANICSSSAPPRCAFGTTAYSLESGTAGFAKSASHVSRFWSETVLRLGSLNECGLRDRVRLSTNVRQRIRKVTVAGTHSNVGNAWRCRFSTAADSLARLPKMSAVFSFS